MARNYIQPGDTLTIPAPAAVLSGFPVIAGDIKGIAQGDAASGAPVDVKCSGVWELPKVGANNFVLGGKVYWSGELATTTASGNTLMGVAVAAADASTATVLVRLSGF